MMKNSICYYFNTAGFDESLKIDPQMCTAFS